MVKERLGCLLARAFRPSACKSLRYKDGAIVMRFTSFRREVRHNAILVSIGLGFLSALRTMASPAWLARSRGARARNFLKFVAGIEMVLDKMPFSSNRISRPQLAARTVSGAASAIYANRNRFQNVSRVTIGGIGAFTAIVATYATFHLRRSLGRALHTRFGISDPVIGVGEDLLSLRVGSLLARKASA
jgi:hypothetical protein